MGGVSWFIFANQGVYVSFGKKYVNAWDGGCETTLVYLGEKGGKDFKGIATDGREGQC
jgi:hypothetical protein